MKAKVIFLTTLFIFFAVISTILLMFFLVSKFSERADEIEKEYYSKVSYSLEGKVKGWQYLGGSSYILEICPTNINFKYNNIGESDSFIGMYNENDSLVFMYAVFGYGKRKNAKNIKNLEIKVSSDNRSLNYSGEYNAESSLSVPDIYQIHLLNTLKSKKDYVKF